MHSMENSTFTHSEELGQNVQQTSVSAELDLLELLVLFSDAKRKIAAYTLSALILGAVLAFVLKPTFTATALILPPQQSQSASSMLGQLGSLASFASGGAIKNPADLYVGILGSRTIADSIIVKFNLSSIYKTKSIEDTRKELKSNTRILATTDGMIHILVDDHTAERASDLANAYVDGLYAMNSHLAITEAAQRRAFFDREMADERLALTSAEDDLKQAAEKTGVILLSGQAESVIRSIAALRAQIASQQIHIQAMRTFATDQNPEQIEAQEEVRAMQGQLLRLEKDPRNANSGSPDFVAGNVPSVSLTYTRKLRELRYHETLFELLSKQYEAARIDEAKASPLIQIVDRAVPPDKKSNPPRIVLVFGSATIGFFFGCLAAVTTAIFDKLQCTPEYALKLARLRRAFRSTQPVPVSSTGPEAS